MIKFNDASSVTRFFPNTLATVCLVKSSFVGPKPPVKTMVSNLDRHCFITYSNLWGLSPITVCSTTLLPILLKSFERYCPFVLAIWPSNNSEPTATIEIFINDILPDIYIVFSIIPLYIFL